MRFNPTRSNKLSSPEPFTADSNNHPSKHSTHELSIDDDEDSATTATTSKQTMEVQDHMKREEDGAPRYNKKSKISTDDSMIRHSSPSPTQSQSQSSTYTTASASSSTTTMASTSSSQELHPSNYLPQYLTNYCEHSHGDFFISPFFDARLIAQLMYEGFLPIATSRFLVPKLHKERCVIYPLNKNLEAQSQLPRQQQQQQNESTENNQCGVHISKSTKKKAKRFTFTVNQEFEKVVQGCHHQHGISWLYPPIVRAFRQLHQASIHSNASGKSTNTTVTKGAASHTDGNEIVDEDICNDGETFPVKLYSVEVYNAQTGKLAGGELGYAVGTLYTSLTGFSSEDSAGSVQLGALGKLLWSLGFDMWDMGMSLAYKTKLGAKEMERGEFVDTVKALRTKKLDMTGTECILKCDEPRSCKDLISLSERI